MRILITAGNTQTPIDEVRCITNIFSGRTGTRIAWEACVRGHEVGLLTSHPEVVELLRPADCRAAAPRVQAYRTFADLERLMAEQVPQGWHAIIHCAAVSDYEVGGIFEPDSNTSFDLSDRTWRGSSPRLVDVRRGKVKSRHPELWLRLTPTPKLVDRIREPWGFRGVLVKFKLEVGVPDPELLEIAERSRRDSQADLLAANTLEGMHAWAYLGPIDGSYHRVSRADLGPRLLAEVERLAVLVSARRILAGAADGPGSS